MINIPPPLEKSLLLIRLTSPVGVASIVGQYTVQTLAQTWEQKVWERALWKNDPASQGLWGSINPFASTHMRDNFIANARRNGRVSHVQVLGIISAYREVSKATGKKTIDGDFITRMIAIHPELLGSLDRLDVGAVAAIVPGWLDSKDGILYEWLHGKSFSTDAKVSDAVARLKMNVEASSQELSARVSETMDALKSNVSPIVTIAVIGGLLWIASNVKTILK